MGYYSIYKIFKDIFFTIFKNKYLRILLIILIAFLFFNLFCPKSHAATLDCNVLGTDTTFELPSWIEENDLNYFARYSERLNLQYNMIFFELVISSSSELHQTGYYGYNNSQTFFDNQSFVYISVSGTDKQNFINGVNNKLSSITYNNNYLNKQGWEEGNNPNYICFHPNSYLNTSSISYISNFNIYDLNNNIMYESNSFSYPFFDNITEIQNGNPDGVFITLGDYAATDNLYFHLLRIDNTVSNSDSSIYYYSDKTFILNKDSSYYRELLDTNSYYYYIPQYNLDLYPNSSYIYILNNSNEQIQNTFGLPEKDIANGIYDVVQSDTTGVISSTEQQTNIMKQQEENMQNINNNLNDINNNINNNFNNTTVSNEIDGDVSVDMGFSNDNVALNNLNNGFFTRLTTELNQVIDYDINNVSTIILPVPFSSQSIVIRSDIISAYIPDALKLIINTMWLFIFTFYLYKFINKIYISFKSGNILNTFNSNDEIITSTML